jgi:formiminoglutamase
MSKPENSQSQKRQLESMGALFTDATAADALFLTSSTDIGVIRNGGRNGARFAPKSFLAQFKRLAQGALTGTRCRSVEVADESAEQNDFALAQVSEARRIGAALGPCAGAFVAHIGGGHDHVYPLLKSLEDAPRVIVLNVDAHADTRTDEAPHSGTPFRQFAREYAGDFFLFELGLHPFANSASTLSPLPRGEMKCLGRTELSALSLGQLAEELRTLVTPKTRVVFSLDADALSGALVPGVSAVNGQGLDWEELWDLWRLYSTLPLGHAPLVGIYELNPLYDTLSAVSMRGTSNFLHRALSDWRARR